MHVHKRHIRCVPPSRKYCPNIRLCALDVHACMVHVELFVHSVQSQVTYPASLHHIGRSAHFPLCLCASNMNFTYRDFVFQFLNPCWKRYVDRVPDISSACMERHDCLHLYTEFFAPDTYSCHLGCQFLQEIRHLEHAEPGILCACHLHNARSAACKRGLTSLTMMLWKFKVQTGEVRCALRTFERAVCRGRSRKCLVPFRKGPTIRQP
jgi:hypothetical protein